jgi:hypothetical protein
LSQVLDSSLACSVDFLSVLLVYFDQPKLEQLIQIQACPLRIQAGFFNDPVRGLPVLVILIIVANISIRLLLSLTMANEAELMNLRLVVEMAQDINGCVKDTNQLILMQ